MFFPRLCFRCVLPRVLAAPLNCCLLRCLLADESFVVSGAWPAAGLGAVSLPLPVVQQRLGSTDTLGEARKCSWNEKTKHVYINEPF